MRERNITMKFIRRNWNRFSKLGKKRKKKQVWRRAKGRDNKIREKRKGYPVKVMIGFKQTQKPKPILVNNVNDLKKIKKGKKVIIGKVGMKKKIEIIKKAKKEGIAIQNLNINKILKKDEKKKEMKKKQEETETKSKETKNKEKKK
jgi:large subunit ribosomal protein L32e